MMCPECRAEGPTGAIFCVGCGRSLQGRTKRFLRWLLGATLLVTGFVMVLVALAPMLLMNHPADWLRLSAGCLMLPAGLASLYQRICAHADGAGRSFCPDCGLSTGSEASPFRLGMTVAGCLALALLICGLPLLLNLNWLTELL